MLETYPQTLEEITPDWLEAALRACGALPSGARVPAVDVERVAEGVGFVGVLARLRPRYDGEAPGAPSSLIIKLPSQEPAIRMLAQMMRLYEHEVRFYAELASRVALRSPRCYASACDPAAGRMLLLFEDLAQTGRLGDQVEGCSDAEAALAVDELARFHAAWWGSPALDETPWLSELGDVFVSMLQALYPALLPTFMERYGDRFPARIRELMPGMLDRVMPLIERFAASVQTLSHGDYRLDNMFFGGDGAGYRLCVLDWQSIAPRWPAYDVTYFLTTNLPAEQRRRLFDPLLSRYHEQLTSGARRDYPLAELRDDVRRTLLVFLAGAVITGGTVEISNERAVQLADVTIERFLSTVEDFDALALL